MASPLIFVPKKVTQDVDFAPHLRQVISRTYAESPDTYREELSLLNRSRQDALRGSAGSDVTARDLLYKYFGQLELLELRFPELRVPFPWNDAFTQVKISQLSLAYEKASVIFNIGATLSSLAASSPRSSPEGLKRAYHSLRCAAGMFTYINDNFLHAPSTDLSREVVKILVQLMSAQATEIFIETMGPGTKAAGLKSKLCMQAAGLYNGMIEEVKDWVEKGVIVRDWSLLIQTKAKYFSSTAQYYRSIADSAAAKHGDSLARLTLAESLVKEAQRLAATFSSGFSSTLTTTSVTADAPVALMELVKTHLGIVTEALKRAQKENDLVYNAVVPSEANLPAIDKGKDIAEPIPIHDVYATAEVQKIVGPDLFSKLVPLSVHESASLYSEEKAKVARAEAERIDLADGELVAALEYMGLPGSLERFKVGNAWRDSLTDPGAQVRQLARELRDNKDSPSVPDQLKELKTVKQRTANELQSLTTELDDEERDCESMRNRFGHLWEQAPSSSLNRTYRQDIRSHLESLSQAGAADARAAQLWDEIRNDIAMLQDGSNASIEKAFAESADVASRSGKQKNLLDDDGTEDAEEDDAKVYIGNVSEGLSRLSKLKKERTDVLKDLKERIQSDDISHLLILNRKGATGIEPNLFATELEKFRPHQQRITATLSHQQSILAEISSDFKKLLEGKRARENQDVWLEAGKSKARLTERLKRSVKSYAEVRSGVGRGTEFYQDLSELVQGLRQQVTSYLQDRRQESQQMASTCEIKQRLESSSNRPHPQALEQQMRNLQMASRASGSYAAPPALPQAQSPWPSENLHFSPTSPGAYSRTTYGLAPLPHPMSSETPGGTRNSYSSPPPPPPPPGFPGFDENATAHITPPFLPSSSPYVSNPSSAARQSYSPPVFPASYASAPASSSANQNYLPPPPAPVSYSNHSGQSPGPYAPYQPQSGYQPLTSAPDRAAAPYSAYRQGAPPLPPPPPPSRY